MDTIWNDNLNKEHTQKYWRDRAPSPRMRWLIILDVLFFAVVIILGGYAFEEHDARSAYRVQDGTRHSISTPSPTSPAYSTSNSTPLPATSSRGAQSPSQ